MSWKLSSTHPGFLVSHFFIAVRTLLVVIGVLRFLKLLFSEIFLDNLPISMSLSNVCIHLVFGPLISCGPISLICSQVRANCLPCSNQSFMLCICTCPCCFSSKTFKIIGCNTRLEIDISRQWIIGPPVLEIWWHQSCKISGGPDVANRQYLFVKSNTADIIYLFLYSAFEQSLQYITFTEKDMKDKNDLCQLTLKKNTVLLW